MTIAIYSQRSVRANQTIQNKDYKGKKYLLLRCLV